MYSDGCLLISNPVSKPFRFQPTCTRKLYSRSGTRRITRTLTLRTTASLDYTQHSQLLFDNLFEHSLMSNAVILTRGIEICELSTVMVNFSDVTATLVGFLIGAVTVSFVSAVREKQRGIRDNRLQTREALADLSTLDENEIKQLVGEIPAWLAFSEIERAGWLNKVVKAAWPYLDAATSKVIVNALDPILQSTRPSFLTSIQFEKFSFGSVPARIEGVKVYDTSSEEALEIDLQVFWAGDPDVVLKIRAAQDTLAVPVSLTEFECTFTLRLIFAPLIGVFPCFGALTLSLTEDPNVNFDLRVVGGDITMLPGMAPPLRTYIQALIASFLVWPRCITVPIPGTGYVLPDSKPTNSGLLHIQAHSHDDLTESAAQVAFQLRWPGILDKDTSHEVRIDTSRNGSFSNAREITLPVEDSLRQVLSVRWYAESSENESQEDGALLPTLSRELIGETNILLDDVIRQVLFDSEIDVKEWGPITIAVELEPVSTVVACENSSAQSQKSLYRRIQNWRSKVFATRGDSLSDLSQLSPRASANLDFNRSKGARTVQMTIRYQSCDSQKIYPPFGGQTEAQPSNIIQAPVVDGQFISPM